MEKTEPLACPFQRYTRTYEGGMAYLPSAGIVCRGESPELTGPAITRLALYEALLQMEPAEVALMLRRNPPPDNKALTCDGCECEEGPRPSRCRRCMRYGDRVDNYRRSPEEE